MKSKKKKDLPAKFENQSADQDFKKLMKTIGVKELNQDDQEATSKKTKTIESEPVVFECNDLSLPASPSSRHQKFSTPKPAASSQTSKRRNKISPGFQPDVELDLHGCTRDQAIEKIKRLLDRSRKQKCSNALIITGRGLNSDRSEGVLRKTVWRWLMDNQSIFNISCRWAPIFLGGEGAVLVFFN